MAGRVFLVDDRVTLGVGPLAEVILGGSVFFVSTLELTTLAGSTFGDAASRRGLPGLAGVAVTFWSVLVAVTFWSALDGSGVATTLDGSGVVTTRGRSGVVTALDCSGVLD